MEEITTDFDEYQKRVTTALVNTTRTAGQIAAGDLSFHRASSSAVSRAVDAQSMRLLQLTNKLLKVVKRPSASKPVLKLHSQESVEDNWRGIVDVIDDLLEKADRNLDEFTGAIKQVGSSSKPVTDNSPRASSFRTRPSVLSSRALPKPQLRFEVQVDNFEDSPWKPLLEDKPHAKVSLVQSLTTAKDGSYSHPYESEIEELTYPPSVYERTIPIHFQEPSKTPITYVDTEQGVSEMLNELKNAREIAVDLEHHDTHSYVGITCLMQISTREKDWVIDTLQPWRQRLQVLNEVFANPHILKVLHGSNMDIIWLQRDFGLYVVGLFDTYHAANALHLHAKSLKYLLSTYAGFDADKKYQLADWRVRPLPEEQLEYARSDTHYLLYVYDHLRNQLIDRSREGQDLVDYVLRHSKEESLQRYSRIVYESETGLGPNGWFSSVVRRPGKFNTQQFAVLRAVHEWRDRAARALDESLFSVMSPKALESIAILMPSTASELMTAATPVSEAVQKEAAELVKVIRKAKEEGKGGVSVWQVIQDNDKLFIEGDNVSRPGSLKRKARLGSSFFTPSMDDQQIQRALGERTSRSQLWGKALPLAPFSLKGVTQKVVAGLQNLLWPSLSPPDIINPPPGNQSPPGSKGVDVEVEPKRQGLLSEPKQDKQGGIFTIKQARVSSNSTGETNRKRSLWGEYRSNGNPEDSSDSSTDQDSSRVTDGGYIEAVPSKKRRLERSSAVQNGETPGQHASPQNSNGRKDSQIANQENGQKINGDNATNADEEDFSKLSKGQRYRRRKAERKRNSHAAQKASTQAPQPMVPLDYGNAPPVLETSNASTVKAGDAKAGTKRPQPFDPYAKALDAPSGLKKAKKGNQGKSMTFH